MAEYFVYIMSSRSSTLYIGVTNDLLRRVYEHKEKFVEGFTKRYSINRLVYYKSSENVDSAIAREKQLKGWKRVRKIALIESVNPGWKDLSIELMDIAKEKPDIAKTVIKRGISVLHSRQGDSSLRSERQGSE